MSTDAPSRGRARAGLRVAAVTALAGALAACSSADESPVLAGSAPSATVTTTASAAPTTVAPAATAATRGAPTGAGSTYVVDCVDGNLVQHPTTITLSCADAGAVVERLSWPTWGQRSTSARGSYSQNDCVPSCASGTVHRYAVTLTLRGLEARAGGQVYTEAVLRFDGTPPEGSQAEESFTLGR